MSNPTTDVRGGCGRPLTLSDVQDRATISCPEAASLLGLNIDSVYRGIREGDIPSLRVGGKRLFVPVPALLRQLGAEVEGTTVAAADEDTRAMQAIAGGV